MTRRNIVFRRPDGTTEKIMDPDPSLPIEDVRELLGATTHPELTNAVVVYHEPDPSGAQNVEFSEKAGAALPLAGAGSPAVVKSAKAPAGTYEMKTSIGRKG